MSRTHLFSLEILLDGRVFRLRAAYSSAFPAFMASGLRRGILQYALTMDFRSLYGCGAAGDLHPSSLATIYVL